MSSNTTNNQGNILGATKFPTNDGTAKAIVSTKRVKINTTPTIVSSKGGGQFINFRFNVYGEYSINSLKHSLNNAMIQVDPKFGVSVRVSIYSKSEKQIEYLSTVLKKGAYIEGLHGLITIDPKYGVQYSVQPSNIGYIHSEGEVESDDLNESEQEQETSNSRFVV